MRISPPQPSVLHLPTIFRQISAGDIRNPAFQRQFVWDQKQIIELLQSVIEGFPIGSILLWGVDERVLRIAQSEEKAFPSVQERYPTNYVLDGMQRLSTLYGVFHFGSSTSDRRFNVYYDLETCSFAYSNGLPAKESYSLPLSALFNPRKLLENQSVLSKMPNSDLLIERLLQLQASFQEYMVLLSLSRVRILIELLKYLRE